MERIVNISSFSSLQTVSTVFAAYFQKKNHRMHWNILCMCCGDSGVVGTQVYTIPSQNDRIETWQEEYCIGTSFCVANTLFFLQWKGGKSKLLFLYILSMHRKKCNKWNGHYICAAAACTPIILTVKITHISLLWDTNSLRLSFFWSFPKVNIVATLQFQKNLYKDG